jgi:hypothetical protein
MGFFNTKTAPARTEAAPSLEEVFQAEIDELNRQEREYEEMLREYGGRDSSERDAANNQMTRLLFLQDSRAVPTPIAAYALVVELAERAGRSLYKSDYNYARQGSVSRTDFSWEHWTPTAGGHEIPALYGSMALDLLILPDVVNQSLTPAVPGRRGWEFGHTTVTSIRKNESGVFVSETNKGDFIYDTLTTHPDVEALRKSLKLHGLVQMLADHRIAA